MESKLSLVIDQLENVKAHNINVYELKGFSPFYDYFVIATTSERQSSAAVNYIKKVLPKEEIKHLEGKGGTWVLMDLGDIIVHLFQQEDRDFYQLDQRLIEYKIER